MSGKDAFNSLGGDNTLADGHPDAKMGGPERGLPRPESTDATMSAYGRILDLIDRIEGCVETVRFALPDRTLDGNGRARNYSAQIETDVRELQALLLDRHLAIQREEDARA